MNLEDDLKQGARELAPVLAEVPNPAPKHGETILAQWEGGGRALRLTRIEHPRTPRLIVAILHQGDCGTWIPIRGGRVVVRLCDLVSFGRFVARALREAKGQALAVAEQERAWNERTA